VLMRKIMLLPLTVEISCSLWVTSLLREHTPPPPPPPACLRGEQGNSVPTAQSDFIECICTAKTEISASATDSKGAIVTTDSAVVRRFSPPGLQAGAGRGEAEVGVVFAQQACYPKRTRNLDCQGQQHDFSHQHKSPLPLLHDRGQKSVSAGHG